MSHRVYIRDLQPAQLIQGAFAVQNCQLGTTRTGKPYIKCLLGDRSGRTAGRMWNASHDLYDGLPTDGFVYIEGETQPYQGEMQIIIREIHPYEPSDRELMDLLPSTEGDVDEMFAEVLRMLQSIEHEPLRTLAERYLEDGELMQKFCQAPAAQTLHHACLGGLLEHTLSVMRVAESILPLYPQVSRDLVLVGLFLHDLGKCAELTWREGMGYSTDGQLVGHIARGVIWLENKARACAELGTPVPEPVLTVLHHIILSHHGQPEFGALKLPSTPEALLISLIDNLDAKMNMGLAATRGADAPDASDVQGHFTERLWALGTRMYRPDPTKLNGEGE
ncbi:MAG: 3'-5' exoribonuclease YhaM family protein [Phycisphaeraceae bacterium]